MNTYKYFIDYKQEDIYDSISKGYFYLAQEDLTKFHGIITYAWQCDIITEEEYKNYRDWLWQTRDTLDIIIKEGV